MKSVLPGEAIKREKAIKGGSRKKKLELISSVNPEWDDLSLIVDAMEGLLRPSGSQRRWMKGAFFNAMTYMKDTSVRVIVRSTVQQCDEAIR